MELGHGPRRQTGDWDLHQTKKTEQRLELELKTLRDLKRTREKIHLPHIALSKKKKKRKETETGSGVYSLKVGGWGPVFTSWVRLNNLS